MNLNRSRLNEISFVCHSEMLKRSFQSLKYSRNMMKMPRANCFVVAGAGMDLKHYIIRHLHFFLYKKLGSGYRTKSFLISHGILSILVPKVS